MNELVGKWNYYFLRYGIGTIIGATFIGFLVVRGNSIGFPYLQNLLSKSGSSEIEFGGTSLTILTALGFAFCYVASAPGLVFHSARGVIAFYQTWRLIFFVACPVIVGFFVSWKLFTAEPLLLPAFVASNSWTFGLCLGAFLAIVLTQFLLLILVLWNSDANVRFYEKLAKKRGDEKNKEYVESYRHLREHANAFEIICFEFVLLSVSISFPWYMPLIIVLWILPPSLCWIVGTVLEKRMA